MLLSFSPLIRYRQVLYSGDLGGPEEKGGRGEKRSAPFLRYFGKCL